MICVGNLDSVSPSNLEDYLHWGTAIPECLGESMLWGSCGQLDSAHSHLGFWAG